MSAEYRFQDRQEAGLRLAGMLGHHRGEPLLVLGLPRGGVVVAYEIARALHAPLDVIVARKLGAPDQPELGIGAIAPGGVVLLDEPLVRRLRLSEEEIGRIERREQEEMARRLRRYRGRESFPEVRGRTVILVDDGLATGVTARAAVRALRQLQPERIVLAVGACPRETAAVMRREVDEFVCALMPDHFRAVGLWFEDFEQNTDEEVIDLLERNRRESGGERAGGE